MWTQCFAVWLITVSAAAFAYGQAPASEGKQAPQQPKAEAATQSSFSFQVSPTPKRYWMGVDCRAPDELLRGHLQIQDGLIVEHVVPKSPAAQSGISVHDILLKVGSTPLTIERLQTALADSQGKELTFFVLRQGKKHTVKVTPFEAPANIGVYSPKLPVSEVETLKRMAVDPSGEVDAEGAMQLRLLGPTVVIEPEKLPAGVSITIEGRGHDPAEIVYKKGEKSQTVNALEIDKLPQSIVQSLQCLFTPQHQAVRIGTVTTKEPVVVEMKEDLLQLNKTLQEITKKLETLESKRGQKETGTPQGKPVPEPSKGISGR